MPAAPGGHSGDPGTGAAVGRSAEKAGNNHSGDPTTLAGDPGGEQGSGVRQDSRKGTGWAGQERGGAQMTWASFYLICFLVGLFLSAFTLLGGMGHFGGHVHLPHAPHLPHAGHLPHGAGTPNGSQGTPTVPWWNAFSIMIFLCWFGAAGYLLTRYGTFVAGVVVVLAAICGVIGGAIIFLFLTRVLMPH